MTRRNCFCILCHVHLRNISSAFQWFDCAVNFVYLIEEEIQVVSTIVKSYSQVQYRSTQNDKAAIATSCSLTIFPSRWSSLKSLRLIILALQAGQALPHRWMLSLIQVSQKWCKHFIMRLGPLNVPRQIEHLMWWLSTKEFRVERAIYCTTRQLLWFGGLVADIFL